MAPSSYPERLARFLALLAAVLLSSVQAAGSAPAVSWERWYSVLLQGRPAGWMHARITREGGFISTEEKLRVTVRRGNDELTAQIVTQFTETEAGVPVEVRTSQKLGAQEVVQTMRLTSGAVDLATVEDGREQRRKLPAPGDPWLTPEGVRRRLAEGIGTGAAEIRYRALEPGAGALASETVMRFVGREKIEVQGAVVSALAWDVTSTALPGVVERAHTDEAGAAVRSNLPLFGETVLLVVQSDRELALRGVDPPEILAGTLVTPQGDVPEPRKLRRAIYRLTAAGAAGPKAATLPDLPNTSTQRVERQPDSSQRVVVDIERAASLRGPGPGEEHLRASTMIDGGDPEVRRLAARALESGEGPDKGETAERLRRFVHGFVTTKDLSVGFASAGQVARTGVGDCTEHAVLLAALLRARGIPSRVASGLIYAESFLGRRGVFAYHMWTQAWLGNPDGGRWVDLDATLDAPAFDAAHLTLGTNALADGEVGNDLLKLVPLIGRLSIEVLEAR